MSRKQDSQFKVDDIILNPITGRIYKIEQILDSCYIVDNYRTVYAQTLTKNDKYLLFTKTVKLLFDTCKEFEHIKAL